MVHCFFEQSGTFKFAFRNLGFSAIDYDIDNRYGNTDFVVDLFREIQIAYSGGSSVFDFIKSDDLIFAFFPCTRFECQVELLSRCDNYGFKNLTDIERVRYSNKINLERSHNFDILCKFVDICLQRKIKLIIENPYTQPHYLSSFWCFKPALIDRDRRLRGDFFRKPTMYYFFNCLPECNVFMEDLLPGETKIIDSIPSSLRSEISPVYADRFIREFLIKSIDEHLLI